MRTALVVLMTAGALLGQETALDRLKREAARMKVDTASTAVHSALRDWIESRLPQTGGTADEFRKLEAAMRGELKEAGLNIPDPLANALPDLGFGSVGFELKWQPEALLAVARVSVGCGTDDTIYAYRFDAGRWARVVEDHPKSKWGNTASEPELSEPDSQGRRLLLTHYVSVQCGSSWMRMAYSVYRLGLPAGAHETLLSGEQGFWLGNLDGPEFVLKPEEPSAISAP
jgi:hypothetical protein